MLAYVSNLTLSDGNEPESIVRLKSDVAFTKPWGFDLSSINKPVKIWQGDQDFMVPHAHSHWLKKHISTAELTFIPGQGHVTLLVDYTDKVFAQAKALLA